MKFNLPCTSNVLLEQLGTSPGESFGLAFYYFPGRQPKRPPESVTATVPEVLERCCWGRQQEFDGD